MSIKSEIERIEFAKSQIRAEFQKAGVNIPDATTLTEYPRYMPQFRDNVIRRVCAKYQKSQYVISALPLAEIPWTISSKILNSNSASLNVYGKNFFDGLMEPGAISDSGIDVNNPRAMRSVNMTPVNPSESFYISVSKLTGGDIWVMGYDENQNPVKDGTFYPGSPSTLGVLRGKHGIGKILATSNTRFVRFFNTGGANFNGEYGVSLIPGYEPFKVTKYHVDFPRVIEKAYVLWADGEIDTGSGTLQFEPIAPVSPGINTLYCDNSITTALWIEDPRQRKPLEEECDGYFATAMSSDSTRILQTETL